MALDADGDPIVLFGKGGAGELFVSKLTGGTFATPVQVIPAGLDTSLANWTGPDIAASGDTVVVVFKAQPVGRGNIYSVRSTDGGALTSFKARVKIDQDGFQGKPDMMYKSGVVHAAFQDLESGNVIYRSGTVGDVTGTEELWNNQVSFFPNPCENEVYISGIDGYDLKKVTVLNSLGQTIRFTLEANTLKLGKSVAGVYSIVFELNDGQVFQNRLIIK